MSVHTKFQGVVEMDSGKSNGTGKSYSDQENDEDNLIGLPKSLQHGNRDNSLDDEDCSANKDKNKDDQNNDPTTRGWRDDDVGEIGRY